MGRSASTAPRPPSIATTPTAPGLRGDLAPGDSVDALAFSGLDLARADLAALVLDGCTLVDCTADGAVLDDARLLDTSVEGLVASGVRLVGATLRDVRIVRSRLGAAEAYSGEWTRVAVTGSRIDYLNLSGTRVEDLLVEDCTVGELDLRTAVATRVRLDRVRLGSLSLAGATLAALDLRGADIARIDGATGLRGAIITPEQLALLAPLLAEAAGVVVAD